VFLLQNLISVIVVYILKAVGAITTEPVTWRLVEVWFPVNILFVSMLVTSTYR
jgi:GDP-mannose transporter